MSYTVTVLLPNGRRQKKPVKLNTPLLMILVDTCHKHQLNSYEFELTFHNRVLDLTSNIQFAGIPNNALLELTPAAKPRTETPINIFLQLESGERLFGSFLPHYSLWNIITELCTEELKTKKNPVIIYMRQEVHGILALQSTTLIMLGLTGGNALLRLIHRTEEQLKNQSVSSVYKLPPKQKPVIEEKLSSGLPPSSQNADDKPSLSEKSISAASMSSTTFDSVQNSEVDIPREVELSSDEKMSDTMTSIKIEVRNNIESMTTTSSSLSLPDETSETKFPPVSHSVEKVEIQASINERKPLNINDIPFIGERYALLFHVDSIPSPKFHLSEDDDFYELTVEDAKTLLRDIKRTRSELEEADLETSAAKAKKKSLLLERTLSVYPHCVVRILFPNRIVLQGVFESTDSVSDVIQFTKSFIDDFILNFYLYISPPKRILNADETLVNIGAVPGINVYFGHNLTDIPGNQIIKAEFLNKVVSPEVAFAVANHFRRASAISERPTSDPQTSAADDVKSSTLVELKSQSTTREKTVHKPSGGKVPKWFKTQ